MSYSAKSIGCDDEATLRKEDKKVAERFELRNIKIRLIGK